MIRSFACADTEALFHSRSVSRFRNIERVARRKLLQIHAATELASLRIPPGNQLEALKADRKGQHSIRINDSGGSVSLEVGRSAQRRDRGTTLGVRKHAQVARGDSSRRDPDGGFHEAHGHQRPSLAADIDVSPSRISELVNGQRPITADTALRLGMFFGMEPRFWLNLQSEYDMRVAERELRAKLAPRIRVLQPVAS